MVGWLLASRDQIPVYGNGDGFVTGFGSGVGFRKTWAKKPDGLGFADCSRDQGGVSGRESNQSHDRDYGSGVSLYDWCNGVPLEPIGDSIGGVLGGSLGGASGILYTVFVAWKIAGKGMGCRGSGFGQ